MALENKTGNAQLEGDAVIIDSAGGYIVSGNQIFLNKKSNSFLATRKPVLIIKQKNDSTYIAADTIYSGFTKVVKNEQEQLKKDSVINVNPHENKKIEEIGANDSLYHNFPLRPEDVPDSAKAFSKKEDSLLHQSKNLPHSNPDVKPHLQPANDSTDNSTGKKNDKTENIKPVSRPRINPKKILQEPVDTEKTILAAKDSTKQVPQIVSHESQNVENPVFNQNDSTRPEHLVDTLIKDSSILHRMKAKDSLGLKKGMQKDTVNKSDSAVRYFLAFHHVRVFNDSLQSVSDSLFLSTKDSVIRLYYDPVIWSGHTQITGDTIYLFTKKKQPERLYVFENGMIVNKTKEGFYNQMAGKTVNGYFVDGKIDYMRVKGSQAESIYYMQDEDSAYIGMNRATGDVIDLYFKNDDLKKVLFVNDIKGNMYPMKQIPEEEKKLKNFKWLDERRPKNKLELFE